MISLDVTGKLSDLQLATTYLESARLRKREDVVLEPGKTVRWTLQHQIGYLLNSPNELRIKLGGKVVFQQDSPEPFELEVALVGVYSSKEPIEEQAIPAYVQTHSVPLLWPYFREIISDLTRRMGGPTLVLPTLSIKVSGRNEGPAEATLEGTQAETFEAKDSSEAEPRPPARKRRNRSKID